MEQTTDYAYGPTSGSVTGAIGLLACAGFAVLLVVDGLDARGVGFLFLVLALGVLLWCYLLRPRIVVRIPESVELRNPFGSWWIPLAGIDVVNVRAVTRIQVGEKSYDAVAVGRTVRSMRRADRGAAPHRVRRHDRSTAEGIADVMTEQILSAVADVRRRGVGAGEPRRTWAVFELALLATFLVAFAITFAF